MIRPKLFAVASMLVITAMLISACGEAATVAPTNAPQPTQAQATEAPAPTAVPTPIPEPATPLTLPAMIEPAEATGDIITAGSSTVFPLTEKMAELFQQEGYGGNITVDSIGTGAGFERFCKTGETDISNASRAIKAEEVEACRALGREPLEFRVGTDALAVVVNPDNPVAERGLSLEELSKIFNGEITSWKQLDAAFEDKKIEVYSPGTDSGTFDYFVEAVLAKDETKLLAVEGAQFSEDDNVLAQGVEGSPYAIGYFGYAYFAEAGDKLKAVPIDTVAPAQDTVDNGAYPLARPLFIYSDAAIMAEKPQVAAFIGFYLQHVNEHILDIGYFPASEKEHNAALGAWYASLNQ